MGFSITLKRTTTTNKLHEEYRPQDGWIGSGVEQSIWRTYVTGLPLLKVALLTNGTVTSFVPMASP